MFFNTENGILPLRQLMPLILSNLLVTGTSSHILRDYRDMKRVESVVDNAITCSYSCSIIGFSSLELWAPEILYQTVVTKVVVISTLSGQPITSASLLPANSTSLPDFDTMSGFDPNVFRGTINQTTRELGPTLTLSVSTHLYHPLLIADCTQAHGQRQCGYKACFRWTRPYSQPKTIRLFVRP